MIMKKFLLGILTLLLFLQPLASKALAFNTASYPKNINFHQEFQSKKQESPSPIIENLVLDAEDEDEFSELETSSCEDTIVCQAANLSYSSLCSKQAAITYSKEVSRACYNKPLYILWSVFRI
jgi:hypothetical protein